MRVFGAGLFAAMVAVPFLVTSAQASPAGSRFEVEGAPPPPRPGVGQPGGGGHPPKPPQQG
ncbi:hypothetical protein ACFV23_37945, partial [Streptomyces sp. NPDC059627]